MIARRKCIVTALLAVVACTTWAQQALTLDSCRALAMANNKELLISREKMEAARHQRKAAFANYLPAIDATGAYIRTQKEISLLSDEQKEALGSIGTQLSGAVQNSVQGLIAQNPGLLQNQQFMQIVQSFSAIDIATPLNQVGNSLVDALRTDTRNLFAGAVTLMAEGYLELLRKLESDVDKMIAEGVATKADGLSVKVKVNEAEMTLTKVEDGLSLSRMLLCQLCGLDLTQPITLADETEEDLGEPGIAAKQIDMEAVYAVRPEVRSLELASKMYDQKVNVTRSEYLPSLALMGSYMATSPSVLNSFEKKFKGMWNVGVMLSVPLWHWGEGIHKVKAAKAEARIARYQLADAKEKIELQVSQSAFKVNEAAKKLVMAEKNLEKADENLRYATLGFEEGVIPASNVLEAHTAWLSAQSEKIDAQIDVKLTDLYLKKATGRLNLEE